MIASELTGLSDLVRFARAQPGSSDYFIGGWQRRGPSGNSLCAIAALAAAPSEAFLEQLLEYDRLCRNLWVVEFELSAALDVVDGIDAKIYQLIAGVTDKPHI